MSDELVPEDTTNSAEKDVREVVTVRAGDLVVDSIVQRAIKASRWPKIKRIAAEWDYNKAGIIEFRELTDGTKRVTKGQGRTTAAQIRNPDMMLLAVRVPYLSDEEEALAALAEEDGGVKSALTANEKWEYAIKGQKYRHLWAVDYLNSLGLTVDLAHPRSFTNIISVAQLTKILYGPPQNKTEKNWLTARLQFQTIFKVLTSVFNENTSPNISRFDTVLIDAVAKLLADNWDDPALDVDRLIARLRSDFPAPVVMLSVADQAPRRCAGGPAGYLRGKLVDSYNFHLPAKSKKRIK